MTNLDAINTLRNNTSDFAQSLVAQFDSKGALSEKQWWWANKLATETLERQHKAEAPKLNLRSIQDLFCKAHAMGIKKPKVILDNIRLQFVNREGRNCGTIAITCDNEYYSRTFYGRILVNGDLLQTRAMTDEVLEELVKLNEDPQKVVSEFGKMHNSCCFCNRELSDNRSVAVGYGKTCAHNYGLPWGEKEFRALEMEQPKDESHLDPFHRDCVHFDM